MLGNRKVLESVDRRFDQAERRLAVDREKIDAYVRETNSHIARSNEEFQMSHQVLADLLKQSRKSHREVMKRLEDLGVHMRQQTEALMRIQSTVDPGNE